MIIGAMTSLLGMVGCGVKGDPVPYVDAYPTRPVSQRAPQTETSPPVIESSSTHNPSSPSKEDALDANGGK